MSQSLNFMSYFVGSACMALAATIGAANSLYAIVDSRRRDLAILRAVGFLRTQNSPWFVSVGVHSPFVAGRPDRRARGVAGLQRNGRKSHGSELSHGGNTVSCGVGARLGPRHRAHRRTAPRATCRPSARCGCDARDLTFEAGHSSHEPDSISISAAAMLVGESDENEPKQRKAAHGLHIWYGHCATTPRSSSGPPSGQPN